LKYFPALNTRKRNLGKIALPRFFYRTFPSN
jgi:hypothetical protein